MAKLPAGISHQRPRAAPEPLATGAAPPTAAAAGRPAARSDDAEDEGEAGPQQALIRR
jgi:hypothetical protein